MGHRCVWLTDNRLSLHLGKTECILFGTFCKLQKVSDFSVTVKDQAINASPSVKYLGLKLDQFMSGCDIVSNMISKANSRLKFLYRKPNFLNLKCRKSLCSSLIQCHLDYFSSAVPKKTD